MGMTVEAWLLLGVIATRIDRPNLNGFTHDPGWISYTFPKIVGRVRRPGLRNHLRRHVRREEPPRRLTSSRPAGSARC